MKCKICGREMSLIVKSPPRLWRCPNGTEFFETTDAEGWVPTRACANAERRKKAKTMTRAERALANDYQADFVLHGTTIAQWTTRGGQTKAVLAIVSVIHLTHDDAVRFAEWVREGLEEAEG